MNNQYEMSNQSHSRRRRRGRRTMSNALDKAEPLVGTGLATGGIRDSEGFITEISASSGSSMGSHRWDRGGGQYGGHLS